MKVLVTGASGRIGRAICVRLARSHEVIGLDASPSSTAHWVGDIGDESLLGRALCGIDAVVHVAALHAPHVARSSEADFQRVNVEATRRLAELAARSGVERFVFTSTTALYGDAATPAVRAGWVTEDTAPRPRTVYHGSKLAAEAALREVSAASAMAVTILRMSRCFPEAVDIMAGYRLHRGIDARDVASGHEAALIAKPRDVATYILSAASPFLPGDVAGLKHDAPAVLRLRCPEFVALLDARGWNVPSTIDRVYDSSRAQAELAWAPRFGFDEVLRQYDSESADVLPPASGVTSAE